MRPRGNNGPLGLDISQVEINQCGVTLPLSSDAMLEINRIAVIIQQEKLPELATQYDDNMDKLAFYAYTACSYGDISTEQLATVLEMRQIKKLNPLHFSIEKIDNSTFENEQSVVAKYINEVYESKPTLQDIHDRFVNTLKSKQNPDAYCFKFSFTESEYTKQAFFEEYIKLAKWFKAALIELPTPDNNQYTITWLSAGARNALCNVVYQDNAKKLFYYSGKLIDREKIDVGIQAYGRYIATSFPGVEDPAEFHKLKTPAFFLTLHDEIHRQLISSIPNPVYNAILETISLLRKTTNREWSPEIWELVDMDFHPINLTIGTSSTETLTAEDITGQFFKLLSGFRTDFVPVGVLLPSPYCDTTWLLLMDLVENADKWIKLGVDAQEMPNKYGDMYLFVKDNLHELSSTLSFPEKLLKLKCDYLHIDYPENASIKFSQRIKNKATYIAVQVDGKPHFYKKFDLMKLLFISTINPVIETHRPSIQILMQTFIEKFAGKPDDLIETTLNYAALQAAQGFLLVILIGTLEKEKINLTTVTDLIQKIEALNKRGVDLNRFLAKLNKNDQLSLLTPNFIDKLLSLPDDILTIAIDIPMFPFLFFKGMDELQLALTDLTNINTDFFNLVYFFKNNTTNKNIKEKHQQYLNNLMSIPTQEKLYYLAIWPGMSTLCRSTADVQLLFTTPKDTLLTLNVHHRILEAILEHSNLDLKTFLNKYSDLIKSSLETENTLTVVNMILTRNLCTLDELFSSYDQTTREQLFKKLDNSYHLHLGTFCRKYHLDLKTFLALDNSLNGMIFNHFPAISMLIYKNPLPLEQLTLLLKTLKESFPDDKNIPLTLKKIIDHLSSNNKPLSTIQLLTLCNIVKQNTSESITNSSLFASKATQPSPDENNLPNKKNANNNKKI